MVLAGGTLAGRVLTIVASPFLTRLYTPADLGRFGIFVAFVGFASLSASLRYDAAIIAARTSEEAAHLALSALVLIAPTSLLFSVILYFLRQFSILGFGTLPLISVLLAGPAIFLIAAFLVLRFWFIREGHFALVSKTFVWQNGMRSVSQVGLGFLGVGWAGLLTGELLGRAVGLSQMAKMAWPSIRARTFPLKLRVAFRTLFTYRKFPLYSLPSSLLDNLGSSLILPLVTQLYGSDTGGQLALTQMVFALPLSLIGGSVSDAFVNRISSYARNDPRLARPFFLKTAGGLISIGLVPTVIVSLWGPNLFQWVFGATWRESGILAASMALLVLAQMVVGSLSQVVFVFQGQELKLLWDTVNLLAVGTIFLGHALGFSAVDAIHWWSLVATALYGCYFLILLKIVG